MICCQALIGCPHCRRGSPTYAPILSHAQTQAAPPENSPLRIFGLIRFQPTRSKRLGRTARHGRAIILANMIKHKAFARLFVAPDVKAAQILLVGKNQNVPGLCREQHFFVCFRASNSHGMSTAGSRSRAEQSHPNCRPLSVCHDWWCRR